MGAISCCQESLIDPLCRLPGEIHGLAGRWRNDIPLSGSLSFPSSAGNERRQAVAVVQSLPPPPLSRRCDANLTTNAHGARLPPSSTRSLSVFVCPCQAVCMCVHLCVTAVVYVDAIKWEARLCRRRLLDRQSSAHRLAKRSGRARARMGKE